MKNGALIAERYRIKSHIGRGGMQDVYLATDILLETDVALKTPQPGQPTKRFSQSAVIAARVNHHNVAKTLDYIEDGDFLYLIEEFVPGQTLDDKAKMFRAIDPHLGTRIFLHLAKGVAASHHAGVIHRDLKPSNVIVEPGVNFQNLKITDFGISSLTAEVFDEAARDGDLTKSTSGTIRGALPFMAPEMMFRSPGDHLGSEMDVWSLGAMMFKLMAGTYPFGVYLQAAVNVQNKARHPWPSFMLANGQYSFLARQLQNLIERCLEYEPSKRPTADAIVTELSDLCFINEPRYEATVYNLIQNGYSGFAKGPKGSIFFSMESVYGVERSAIARNSRICYSSFPGEPRFRGHPIVVMAEPDSQSKK